MTSSGTQHCKPVNIVSAPRLNTWSRSRQFPLWKLRMCMQWMLLYFWNRRLQIGTTVMTYLAPHLQSASQKPWENCPSQTLLRLVCIVFTVVYCWNMQEELFTKIVLLICQQINPHLFIVLQSLNNSGDVTATVDLMIKKNNSDKWNWPNLWLCWYIDTDLVFSGLSTRLWPDKGQMDSWNCPQRIDVIGNACQSMFSSKACMNQANNK